MMLGQMGCAAYQMAHKRREYDGTEIVIVRRRAHFVGNFDLAQQLFFDFAMQCLTRRFMRFDLAARKLPETSQ